MGGFTSKQFAPAIVAALVGAVVSIGTLTVAGTSTFRNNVTVTRDDQGSHSNRPSITVQNSAVSGAFNHRADVAFEVADSGGVLRQHLIEAEGQSLVFTPFTDVVITKAAQLNATLSVFGNATLGDANADLATVNGHLRITGTAPSLSSCGTSPIIVGSDMAGRFQTGTGATACTITFSRTFTVAPACVLMRDGSATPPTCTPSATAITCTVAAAATIYSYVCMCAEGTCT